MKNQQNQALTALMRSLKRALKQQHGIDVPHAALRASFLSAQGENPHAFASKQVCAANSPSDGQLRILVQEAPRYFHPGYDFDGEKLQWLQRAGLVPSSASASGEANTVRTFFLAEDAIGCNVRLALSGAGFAMLPDDFMFEAGALQSLKAEIPRVSKYGLPDYLSNPTGFFGQYGLKLSDGFVSAYNDLGDDSGDTCQLVVSMSHQEWRSVVDTVLENDPSFRDTVAEWVGVHYAKLFSQMDSTDQAEWVERYLEAHAEMDVEEAGESDPSKKLVMFEYVYPDEDGGSSLTTLDLNTGVLEFAGGQAPPDDIDDDSVRTRIWVDEEADDAPEEPGDGEDFEAYFSNEHHKWMLRPKTLKAVCKLMGYSKAKI